MKKWDRVAYHGPNQRLWGRKGQLLDMSRGYALVLMEGDHHPITLPIADVHSIVSILDVDAAEMETHVTAADSDVISEEVDYIAITRSFCR